MCMYPVNYVSYLYIHWFEIHQYLIHDINIIYFVFVINIK